MSKFTGYKCSLCGTEYLPGQVTYTCPKDGGNLDVVLDYEAIRKKYQPEDVTSRTEPSLWKYLPLLPVSEPEGSATPLHASGGTPVFALPRLAEKLGLKHLWLKDESRNPTASFKDRASAVVVTRARELKSEVVVTASTGNAGAALAGGRESLSGMLESVRLKHRRAKGRRARAARPWRPRRENACLTAASGPGMAGCRFILAQRRGGAMRSFEGLRKACCRRGQGSCRARGMFPVVKPASAVPGQIRAWRAIGHVLAPVLHRRAAPLCRRCNAGRAVCGNRSPVCPERSRKRCPAAIRGRPPWHRAGRVPGGRCPAG